MRIGVDDDAAEFLGDRQRRGRLAAGGRPGDDDHRRGTGDAGAPAFHRRRAGNRAPSPVVLSCRECPNSSSSPPIPPAPRSTIAPPPPPRRRWARRLRRRLAGARAGLRDRVRGGRCRPRPKAPSARRSPAPPVDVNIVPAAGRRKKLLCRRHGIDADRERDARRPGGDGRHRRGGRRDHAPRHERRARFPRCAARARGAARGAAGRAHGGGRHAASASCPARDAGRDDEGERRLHRDRLRRVPVLHANDPPSASASTTTRATTWRSRPAR